MGCQMFHKMHFLHSHLKYFSLSLMELGAVSDERFHQDISEMESSYQPKHDG